MHPLLLYISILATASAVRLPLLPRMDPEGPCEEYVASYEGDDLGGPTADGTAGLGIEFESIGLYFVNDGCSLADTNAAKTKIISGRTGQNWKLTADTGSGAGKVQAEYILDGKNIKVGDGSAARAASAAAQDLIDWKPWKGNRKGSIQIQDSNCNPWDIGGPSINQDPNKLPWEPQVTAPMPLEALYSLMKEQAGDTNSNQRNILNGYCMEGDCIVLVTKDYFQSKPNNIDGTRLTDDVFGFLTLVLSYAKAAKTKTLKPDQSPKQLLSFMPRTEFNTLYGEVKSKIPGDLFTLLDTLACYTTTANSDPSDPSDFVVTLDKSFCSGTAAKPVSKNVLAGASFQNPGGNPASVNIKAWIQGIGALSPSPDLLTAFDSDIDKSIGGFGTDMEKMYNSQRLVPLFEFRSLNTMQTVQAANVDGFESFAAKADSAVQALHRQFANPPGRKLKRQDSGSCSLTAPPTSVLSSSTTAAPSVSCQYQDGTPEQSEACTCVSGSSTTVVQPMTLSSISIITQSCDYTTWPGGKPAVTSPPATVSTNFPGCQVCTIVGPNEDNCSPLPSSLGCTPEKSSTVLTADTSGVAVGTLTGSALYSAITSGIDQVCQVPPNNGATSSFTCTETATATLSPDIVYYDTGPGEAQFKLDGSLTLQITEANYDSLEWYATNKAILAAMAQNSTQNNCKSDTGIYQSNASEEKRTISLCKVGSNFQLTEFDPTSNAPSRELSFDLRFQTGTEGSIACEFLADVIEFIETSIAAETDTEETLPEELKVDQKLLAACESAGVGSKF